MLRRCIAGDAGKPAEAGWPDAAERNVESDLFEDLGAESFDDAKRWVHAALGLAGDPGESIHLGSDAARAEEIVRFYFEHPELRGWRRHFCAEVAADSVIELIEPEAVDGRDGAQEDVAESLVRRLLSDRFTAYHLLSAVRPEMRAIGAYPTIVALIDRVSR